AHAGYPAHTFTVAFSDFPGRYRPPAHVGDAVGLDLPGVDGRLLLALAHAGQVGEEVGPVAEELGVEPVVQFPHDLLARVQALLGRPRPPAAFPGQPARL